MDSVFDHGGNVVEALANQVYYMELNGEPSRRVWAYRKAAWAIDLDPTVSWGGSFPWVDPSV